MPERMGQWTLLGHHSDPVVADTAVIDERVAHYRKIADEMQANATRLDRIADGTALKGKYADELRSSSGEVARDLHKVVGRYQAVATALETYEPAVEHALTESQIALDDAVAANGVAQAADGMPTEEPADGQQLTADQTAHNDEKTARTNQAASALDAAKARLSSALGSLDAAGQAASRTISGGFDDGLKDSGWDRFVYAFMKFLKILVKILTYIAMALAVIALVIPGLGEIIFAAGLAIAAVDVAANAALVAAGEGTWADFGIALAGLLTFGVGKLFGPAIQAGLKSVGSSVKSSVSGALDTARNGLAGLRGPRPAVAGLDDAGSSVFSGRSSFESGGRGGGSGNGGGSGSGSGSGSGATRDITADDFPSAPTHEPRNITADDFPSAPTHEPRAGGTPDAGTPPRPATPEVVPADVAEAVQFVPSVLKRQGDSMLFKFKGEGDELRFRGEDPDTFEQKFTVERTGEEVKFDVDENAFTKLDGSPAEFNRVDFTPPADGYNVRNFVGTDFPKADSLADLGRIGNADTPVLVRVDQLPVQVRTDFDPARVASIEQAVRDGKPLPAVGLSRDGGSWTINDGNHRIQAARDLGLEWLPVTVS